MINAEVPLQIDPPSSGADFTLTCSSNQTLEKVIVQVILCLPDYDQITLKQLVHKITFSAKRNITVDNLRRWRHNCTSCYIFQPLASTMRVTGALPVTLGEDMVNMLPGLWLPRCKDLFEVNIFLSYFSSFSVFSPCRIFRYCGGA